MRPVRRMYPLLFAVAAFAVVAGSCRGPKITRTDTETSGFAQIAVDQTLEPVVNEQLAVFTGLNPEATIEPIFTGERELFELLMSDSVRLIIAARDLTRNQLDSLRARRQNPRSQILARDGIALIVNRVNPDSLIGLPTLRDVLTGKITRWDQISPKSRSSLGEIQVVFDHPSSSMFRFINDSILRNEPLSGAVSALQSNLAVVNHVTNNPNALGVVGINWVKNLRDSSQLDFIPDVRVMGVGFEREVNWDNAVKPFPAYLNNGTYPLIRDIFIILTDSFGTLPSGFVRFAAGDAGQRIILKAGLVPGTRPIREIMLQVQ